MNITGFIPNKPISYYCDLFNSLRLMAPIIGIQRHRLKSDGEGVTTLVGFHGCPLSCKQCLNPQCKDNTNSEMLITTEKLYQLVKVDDLYFQATGGGVTFGGGEPLCYPKFITEFHELCKDDGWNLRVETSLNVRQEAIKEVLPCINEFIVDIKDMNPDIYKAYTGMDNKLVKDNLRMLVEQGAADKILLRIPSIEGFNTDEDIRKSKIELKEIGLEKLDCFSYETPSTLEDEKTVYGKNICRILKEIRKVAANINDIEYEPSECLFEGDCPGTCPKCDEELKTLTEQLHLRKKNNTFREIPKQDISFMGSQIRIDLPDILAGDIIRQPVNIKGLFDF